MRVAFRKSFARDLKNIRSEPVRHRVRSVIEEVEAAATLSDIRNLAKLRGRGDFYHIQIGRYRIGVAVEGDEVEFVRCLDRREVYRYFP